jgi:hypothetical protein
MVAPPKTPLEDELNELEVLIRQLKQQYDIFFSGAAKRQPFENRKEVDLIVKRIGVKRMQRFSDRYRYNSLSNRFQTYCELWAKNIRSREEGYVPGGARQSSPSIPRKSEPRKKREDSIVFKSRFRDPTLEDDSFKSFYDKYLEARQSSGKSGQGLGYSTFLKTIAKNTQAIKAKSGCDQVAYTIVVKGDGAVALKAAPVKEKKK